MLLTAVSSISTASDSEPTPINDIGWNSNGKLLAVGSGDENLRLMVTSDQSLVSFFLDLGYIGSLSWNPTTENQLAITTRYNGLKVLEVTSEYYEIADLHFRTDQEIIEQVAWSPDGKRLATIETRGSGAGGISKVIVWNPKTGDLLSSYQDGASFNDIAWNPQKPDELLITGIVNDFDAYPMEILVWNTEDNTVLWQIENLDNGVTDVEWNPDGTQFAALTTILSDEINQIDLYDGNTGKATNQLPTNQEAYIAWTPGQCLAVSYGDTIGYAVDIWDTTTNKMIQHFKAGGFVKVMDWLDGRTLAYGTSEGAIEIVSLPEATASAPQTNP